MDNDLEMSRDMHSNWERKGKMPMNPFNELADELEYEIALMFVYTNVYGAEIYEDPLGRYTFKSVEHKTPFHETPMVNYQGDQYMGTDGARYVVTNYHDFATHTTRPEEVAFVEDTRVPTFVHPQQAAPSLSEWTTGRGPTPMPPWREAREQNL